MLTYALFKTSHLARGGSLLITHLSIEMSTNYYGGGILFQGYAPRNITPTTEVSMTIFPNSEAYEVRPGQEWFAIQAVLTYPSQPRRDAHMVLVANKKEPGIVWQMVSPAGAPVMVIYGNENAYFMSDEPGLVISGASTGFADVTHYTVKMTFDHYHNGVNYSAIRDDLETFDPEGYHAP